MQGDPQTEPTPAAVIDAPGDASSLTPEAPPADDDARGVEPLDARCKNARQAGPADTPPIASPPIGGDQARAEAARFIETFGAEAGARWFAAGKSYEEARELHLAALQAENLLLRNRLAAIASAGEPAPVSFNVPPEEAPGHGGAALRKDAEGNLGPALARLAAANEVALARTR